MQPKIKTLSNRAVGKLTVEKDTVFWDRDLTGFGVRVYPAGSKVYVAQARGPKGPRRVTVGRHGVIHADEARKRAAMVIARVKAGDAPVAEPIKPVSGPTVAELAGALSRGTRRGAVQALERRALPLGDPAPYPAGLGRDAPIEAVERAQVVELHQGLCEAPAAANRAVRVLSTMYRLAGEWGMAPEGTNPCRAIARYPARRRERFLTDAEFNRLGRALDETEVEWRRLGLCGGGAPASRPDGMQEVRDTLAALGGRGARRGGTEARRFQDGRAGGAPCRPPRSNSSHGFPARRMSPGSYPARSRGHICATSITPGASSARGRDSVACGSTISVIPTPAARWRSARGFP